MAQGLVEALSDDFQPEQYTDEYRTAVEQVIEEKAAGRTPVFEAEADTAGRRHRPRRRARGQPRRGPGGQAAPSVDQRPGEEVATGSKRRPGSRPDASSRAGGRCRGRSIGVRTR